MGLVNFDVFQIKWVVGNCFSDIPSDYVSCFLLNFTDEFLGNLIDEKLAEKPGRPIYSKKKHF